MSLASRSLRVQHQPPIVDIRSLNPRQRPMDGVKVIDPIFLRAVDAAKALSISVRHLYRILEAGEGPPAIKLGHKPNSNWRFHYRDLLKWADRKSREAQRKQAEAKKDE